MKKSSELSKLTSFVEQKSILQYENPIQIKPSVQSAMLLNKMVCVINLMHKYRQQKRDAMTLIAISNHKARKGANSTNTVDPTIKRNIFGNSRLHPFNSQPVDYHRSIKRCLR